MATDTFVAKALAYRVEEDNKRTLTEIRAMLDHEPRIKAAHKRIDEQQNTIETLERENGRLTIEVSQLTERVEKWAKFCATLKGTGNGSNGSS